MFKLSPQTRSFYHWFWFFFKPFWGVLAFFAVLQTVRRMVMSSEPFFIAKIISLLEDKVDFNTVLFWIVGFFALFSVANASIYFLKYMAVAMDRAVRNMSLYALKHILSLPLDWHEMKGSGARMQQISTARKSLIELYYMLFWDILPLIAAILAVIVSITAMRAPAHYYGLFSAYVVVYMTISTMTGKWMYAPQDKLNKSLENVFSKIYEFANGVATVKIFNIQKPVNERAEIAEWHSHETFKELAHVRAFRWMIVNITGFSFIMLIISVALYDVTHDIIDIGLFTLIAFMAFGVWDKIEGFGRIFGSLVEHVNGVWRLFETLNIKSHLVDRADAVDLQVTDGQVRFENVSFAYNDDQDVLSDFELTIDKGQKIGLVGKSGAGKTTIAKVLLRFYDIQSGRILIDGQDIAHVTQASLHQQIGMIPQDIMLFNDSVTENIRIGRLDATDEEVLEAARLAYVDQFAPQLQNGYDTIVGERGVRLSGGQRQRIGIARAILKNAPILILDEATSALDSESEKQVQDALKNLMTNKTVIVIAHRLSTINHLDSIIVMDQGKIMEQGHHSDLIKNPDGRYAQLWALQSGGFLFEDE
jgi:ABC-type multidrug transport system fused ATPase/permease subunit